MTCVKWCNVWSSWFTLRCGIRQGGVLSPCLFAIYVDGLVNQVKLCAFGCYIRCTCISILLYADDILLLAPSILNIRNSAATVCVCVCVCEKELDMSINVKKSTCLRIGARCNVKCECITTSNGGKILWADNSRYLGVYITASHKFCCSLSNAKKSFYRAFNCVFGKLGRVASENVILDILLKVKCLPCLYYGLDACPLIQSQLRSLEFAVHLEKYFP